MKQFSCKVDAHLFLNTFNLINKEAKTILNRIITMKNAARTPEPR